MEYEHIVHPFGPLYDARSKILILGSLPSVKSREASFFYGHPQNRYWPLMASLLGEPVPATVEEKKELVLSHRIAMWDSIYSCDIRGSGDSSIRNVVPTDLKPVIEGAEITAGCCNGWASYKYYRRCQETELGIGAVVPPSPSPANAAWSFERLREEWKVILEYL